MHITTMDLGLAAMIRPFTEPFNLVLSTHMHSHVHEAALGFLQEWH